MEDLRRARAAITECRGVLCDAESTLRDAVACFHCRLTPSSASPASPSVSGPSTSDLLAMLKEKDELISKLRKELKDHVMPNVLSSTSAQKSAHPEAHPSLLAGAGEEEHTKEDVQGDLQRIMSWLGCHGIGAQDLCKDLSHKKELLENIENLTGALNDEFDRSSRHAHKSLPPLSPCAPLGVLEDFQSKFEQNKCAMSWLPTLSNCGLDDHQDNKAAAAQRVMMWLPDSEHRHGATIMARQQSATPIPKLNPPRDRSHSCTAAPVGALPPPALDVEGQLKARVVELERENARLLALCEPQAGRRMITQ